MNKLVVEVASLAIVASMTAGATYVGMKIANENRTIVKAKVSKEKKYKSNEVDFSHSFARGNQNTRQMALISAEAEVNDLKEIKQKELNAFREKMQKQKKKICREQKKRSDERYDHSKVSRYIFVGDSRFVGMSAVVRGERDVYIAKVGKGLEYFKQIADQIKSVEDKNSVLIIGFGVNDLQNARKYADFVNNADFRSKVFFLTVNPVDESKESSVTNSGICHFNNKILDMAKNYDVIDTYTCLATEGINTIDGLHYDNATYKLMYNFIKGKID